MEKQWYEKPMRIAALQCNFEEGKTLEVSDKWQAMGFNVEQLFHPMGDGYSALFHIEDHADILTRYLERSRKNGIRIILYLNVHIIEPSDNHRRDEWAQQDKDGTHTKLYGTYYACCVNSPWRDHFFSVIDSLAPFEIGGVFLDGPVVIGGGCHCPSCVEAYRRAHGGDLRTATDTEAFYRESIREFLRQSYERFKKLKPAALFYINLPAMHRSLYMSLAEVLPYNDIVGTEGGFMFYGPPQDADLWKPGIAAKFLEAIAPQKARVVFMAGDQKPWSWYQHTATETKLCIASSVASGANIWYGLHGSTKLLATPGGQAAGEIVRMMAENEAHYEATESAARLAVFYSLATEANYRTSGKESDFYGEGKAGETFPGNVTEAFHGFADVLCRSGIPWDIVTDLELTEASLSRYDCVMLPTCACLSDATIGLLREFVRNGGNLIGSFDTSLYDDRGRPRGDFGLGDVFGVRYLGKTVRYQNFNYFRQAAASPLFDGVTIPLLPAPGIGIEVEARSGAEVLARFLEPLAGRYVALTEPKSPALVVNSFGSGHSLFLAGTFGEHCYSYCPPEYRAMLKNAVGQWSRLPVRLEGGVGNVEVVARKQKGRLIVHLVNYAGLVPRPFERVCRQTGVTLTVAGDQPYRSARALAAKQACALKRAKEVITIEVPAFDEYEVILLE